MDLRYMRLGRATSMAVAVALLAAMGANAQSGPSDGPNAGPNAGKTKAAPAASENWAETRKRALEIGSQPTRDIGIMRRETPPILEKATRDPYSLKGLKTCKQLAAEVGLLNEALGPDYIVGNEIKESRAGKLAEAGGKTVVNAIIPFRGLVREISGAAPAERRLEAAIDAGLARRGFLRGVHAKQGCRTRF